MAHVQNPFLEELIAQASLRETPIPVFGIREYRTLSYTVVKHVTLSLPKGYDIVVLRQAQHDVFYYSVSLCVPNTRRSNDAVTDLSLLP